MHSKTEHGLLQLPDNHYGDPQQKGRGKDVSAQPLEIKNLLWKYQDRTLAQWAELGITVFPSFTAGAKARDDESHELSFFTVDSDACRTWINSHNCMGVVRLRDKNDGTAVQIEIGSRFDAGEKPFFLAYLLSKVFGGSIVDKVTLGPHSLWDMLLAFVFRRRLLEASGVGLFRQYRTFHHNDNRIRGRIDLDCHLRRNIPFCGNVAYARHEITFDNPTNHLIRHALAKLGRKWGGLLVGDNRLTEMRHRLEENTPTWECRKVIACVRCKENQNRIRHPYFYVHYEYLRQLSLSILRDEGASLYQQEQEAEGVIFDGAWLWEEYLWTLLIELGFEHPENKRKIGALNPLQGITFYPDFFHRDKRAVLDAKYQAEGISQDHAKQVFAYMFLLDAVHGGLIKPSGSRNERKRITREIAPENEAWWHTITLAPPAKSTAREFVNEMRNLEREFKERILSHGLC